MTKKITWWKVEIGLILSLFFFALPLVGLILLPLTLAIILNGLNIDISENGDKDERNGNNRKL